MNLNTPVVPLASAIGDRFLSQVEKEKQVLTDINDAIAVATGSLGLIPGSTFQARVSQLAELNTAHKTVWVDFMNFQRCQFSNFLKAFFFSVFSTYNKYFVMRVYHPNFSIPVLILSFLNVNKR